MREEDIVLQKAGITLDAKDSVKLLAETFYAEDKGDKDNKEHREIWALAEKINAWEHDEYHLPKES